MSYVEFDAFKQTPQYRKALCDALAITARKGGNPIPGVVDSEMNRAFQALNKISPALATGIAYTESVGNKMYNYFLSDAGQNALRIAEQAATNFADITQATALSYISGRTLGNFDELAGIAGGTVGAGKAAWNGNNIITGFQNGYINVRDDLRNKIFNYQQRYPYLTWPIKLSGTIQSGLHLSPSAAFTLSAVGYPNNLSDIPQQGLANFLANGISSGFHFPFFNNSVNNAIQTGISDKLSDDFYNLFNQSQNNY